MDLFETSHEYALAHCISKDCKMGAGIAVEFKRRFSKLQKSVMDQNPQIGDAINHYSNQRLLFNLITKEKYWHKPTYKTFRATIENLKEGMRTLNSNKLAVPLLGAGLDGLNWENNREIIKEIFKGTDMEILVCIKK